MSKRRITHQQAARIRSQQNKYQHTVNDPSLTEGLVIARYGRYLEIETPTKQRIRCTIRSNMETIVAGDHVIFRAENEQQGVVVSLNARQSVLGRPDAHGQIKPIAANLSQLVIVIAPKPEISWPLLDSYLIIAEFLHLKACIVLNKIDLDKNNAQQDLLLTQYQPLGYPVVFTSHHQPQLPLEHLLNAHTSVFVGQSGVGKSSLINQILPEYLIQTGALSTHSNLGRHTTSYSTLYHLPQGGALIDSPGVREFGLWHLPAIEIARSYREFRPHLSDCRFRDCNHQTSPGCAILLAVKKGEITQQRYQNYVKISTQFSK